MTHFTNLLDMTGKTKDGKVTSKSVVRVNQVRSWFERYGFASFGKDKKTGKLQFRLSDKARKEISADHFKVASANPWNTLKSEGADEFHAIKSNEAIAALIKRLEKAANDDARNVINADHLAALKAIIAPVAA
jgi:hypothetical protein